MAVTPEQLQIESGVSDLARCERVLPVAAQFADDYLNGGTAPESLIDEAVIRFASYLVGSDVGAIRTESEGEKSVEYVVNHSSAFRNSGAASLLTRYRIRRAGKI